MCEHPLCDCHCEEGGLLIGNSNTIDRAAPLRHDPSDRKRVDEHAELTARWLSWLLVMLLSTAAANLAPHWLIGSARESLGLMSSRTESVGRWRLLLSVVFLLVPGGLGALGESSAGGRTPSAEQRGGVVELPHPVPFTLGQLVSMFTVNDECALIWWQSGDESSTWLTMQEGLQDELNEADSEHADGEDAAAAAELPPECEQHWSPHPIPSLEESEDRRESDAQRHAQLCATLTDMARNTPIALKMLKKEQNRERGRIRTSTASRTAAAARSSTKP